ncbi:hypothetical protein HRI_001791600 [Hibiscus trionum]|uniref:RNase H type-1 domain-containing protein n=1 Tax=Hibiscus trionum TaxID=183268 RepID=A0A9W7HPM0_HIBTR|nr:hypothetical protein HRI_001791600 [Hibiscus trionum]
MFSLSIGCVDVTTAEIRTVLEALKLFRASKWFNRFRLVVESDCELVIQCLRCPIIAPPVFKPLIQLCLDILGGCDCTFQYTPRECNKVADKLARSGIARLDDLVLVFDK